MRLQISLTTGLLILAQAAPCLAQSVGSGANSGSYGRPLQNTLKQATQLTMSRLVRPANAQTVPLGGIFSPATRNGLPSTTMDSFVTQAGGNADLIYGDEGVVDIPPYDDFTKEHRINAGIYGQRAQGLSTGHSSVLPDAWGGDEFVKGPEFDMSGNGSDKIPRVLFGAPINGISF